MSDQRFIIEMGMGNDLHGQDYTKAAARAIEDAVLQMSGDGTLTALSKKWFGTDMSQPMQP